MSQESSTATAETVTKLRHVDLIGVLGKRHVFSILDQSGNPDANIQELQRTAGMDFPCRSALPFLDLLQVPRAVVYQHLFEAAKEKLDKRLQGLSQHKLIEMLSATIRYLGVAELKSLPISILKKLSFNVPLKYLHFIAKNCKQSFILDDIPIEVRQLVWHVDASTFIHITEECCKKCFTTYGEIGQRSFEDSILQVCKYIGNSQILFSKFALVCLKHSLEPCKDPSANIDNIDAKSTTNTNSVTAATPSMSATTTATITSSTSSTALAMTDSRWCTLLRHVLVNLARDKIKALGKLRDMAWQLNNFIRESNLNPDNTQTLITDRRQLKERLAANNIGVSSIYSYIADIKRVFVASHERSSAASMSQHTNTTNTVLCKHSKRKSTSINNGSSSSSRNRLLSFDEKLQECWSHISKLDRMKIFACPVTEDMAPGYFSVVKHPMDLSTIHSRLPSEQLKTQHTQSTAPSPTPYTTLDEFEADLKLMFDNCFLYNEPGNPVLKEANKLWQSWLKNKHAVFGSEAGSVDLTLNTTPALPLLPAPPPPRIVVKSSILSSNSHTPLPPPPTKEHKATGSVVQSVSIKLEKEKTHTATVAHQPMEETTEKPPLKMNIKLKKSTTTKNSDHESKKLPSSFPLKVILKKALEFIWRVESDVHINGPYVGIFSNPVTEEIAPEYFSIIKYPMDLSTLHKRITSNSYKSLGEFEEDLKLIFDNCREYNVEPGNILCKIGDNLWDFWVANRRAIEKNPEIAFEKLKPPKVVMENGDGANGVDISQENVAEKKNAKTKRTKTNTTTTSSTLLNSLERDLTGQKSPPSGLIARKKGADKLQFVDTSPPLTDRSSEQIISKKSKDSGPSLYSKSKHSSKSSSSLSIPPAVLSAKIVQRNNEEQSSAQTPVPTSKTTDNKLNRTLQKALDLIWKVESDEDIHGSLAGMFSSPVTEQVAPGYFSYIKRPMDLSTMQKKLTSHSYHSVDQFAKDLQLIVENCKIYNEPESVFSKVAENLWTFWEANRAAIEANPDITYVQLVPPSVVEVEKEGNRPWPELAAIPDKDKIEIKESHLLHEALERAVEFLSTEDDSKLFATDVNIPGYTDIIKKPRSLNFINSRIVKYKSVEAFESDVRLMFKNCIKFNEPNKDYFFSDLAVKLWQSWLANRKHILLDTEAGPSTTSTVKRAMSGQKRSREASLSKDDSSGGSGGNGSKKNDARAAMALMEDEEDEEFEMDVAHENDDDEDYGFLDDDEDDSGTRKSHKFRRASKKEGNIGTSNMELFDEESSDDEEDKDHHHSKKKKTEHAKPRKPSSSAGAGVGAGRDRKPATSTSSSKKASSSTGSSSSKRPPNRQNGKPSLPMMPLIPLHRMSSTKILKAPLAGGTGGIASSISGAMAAPRTATTTAGTKGGTETTTTPLNSKNVASTAVATVVAVGGQGLTGSEKLQFSRNMLRWAVALLRDSQLQVMFKQHLCDLLLSLERTPVLGQGVHALKSLGGSLPYVDTMVGQCLWLCQAGVDVSDGIYELKADAYLLREAMPFLMHYHLTLNTATNDSLPTSSGECEVILKDKLDLALVSFGEDKAAPLLADIMFLLVSSKNLDGSKKSSLNY